MITAALILGFFLMVVASVMFSGAEHAVGSISRDSIEKLAENDAHGANIMVRVTENKRRFQLMLLTGRILSIILGAVSLLFGIMRLISTGDSYLWQSAVMTILLATVAFVTTEGLLSRLISVGELEATVERFAAFLYFSDVLLSPLTIVFDLLSRAFIKKNVELAAKEEALIELVKSESESGVIEQEEGEMIQSILSFSDTAAREVMVPRIDVIAADATVSVDELIRLFKEEGHSRIPIFQNTIDNIVGVMYTKDLLIAIAERGKENVSIAETMRKPYFIPETKKISELLKDLKKARIHLAIVVDEYGGTSGIVALEDLLEEIVGDIQDEYDMEEEREYSWIDNQTVLMDASLNIEEVNDVLRSNIPNDDYDTLGGFIYRQLGFIPEGGETVDWESITFSIKEINGNRISKVLVKLPEPRQENEHTEA